jgi:hypothetical protein
MYEFLISPMDSRDLNGRHLSPYMSSSLTWSLW